MQSKKTIEFKRSIRALASQEGWLVEVEEGKGPTERIVVYFKQGNEVRRIASIILRADEKEISPGVARALIRKLRARVEDELADQAASGVREAVEALMEWIKSWF
jgi:hypothetical protein